MRFPIAITTNPLLRPLLAMLGVGSANSWLDLDSRGLTVRMGVWFEEFVPLSDIAEFGPSEWPSWSGYGVKFAPRQGIGVVASGDGVFHIGLHAPRRMNIAFMWRDAERLWVSVERRDEVLAALERLTGLPVSPPVGFWQA